MEGNDCYKFSTIQNYIDRTDGKPVRLAIDIGANIGEVTLQMRSFFPNAQIFAFEPIEEYYHRAAKATRDDAKIKVFNLSVTSNHLFQDDFGDQPQAITNRLKVLKALPHSGVGYLGGSIVTTEENMPDMPEAYEELNVDIALITFDDVISATTQLAGVSEVDYVKMDCEGCEHSALGAASIKTLRKIRFIGGEYHGLQRFYQVMKKKLFRTHYVSLIGDADLGAFFCERIGEEKTILNTDRAGMLFERPWLCDEAIDWHSFREEFVLPHERHFHALE